MDRILRMYCKIRRPKTQWLALGVISLLMQTLIVHSSPVSLRRSSSTIYISSFKSSVKDRRQNDNFISNDEAAVPNAIKLNRNKEYEGTQTDIINGINYNIDERLNAVSNSSYSPETSSELPITNYRIGCIKEEIDILAENIQDICSCFTDIDNYAKKVISMEKVRVPSFKDVYGLKDIITHYNDHVKVAKHHCYPWRRDVSHAGSIVRSVKEMITEAQEFSPKIKHDFAKIQRLVADVVKDHEYIIDPDSHLTKAENESGETVKNSITRNDFYLSNTIITFNASKGAEMRNNIEDNIVSKAKHEVEALIDYLEGIRNAAAVEKRKVGHIRSRLRKFRENLLRDATAFKKHRAYSQNGIRSLKRERDSNNQELVSIQRDIQELRRWTGEERNQILHLKNEIHFGQNELRILDHNFKKLKASKPRKCLRVVPIPGSNTKIQMVRDARTKENERLEQKRAVVQERMELVKSLQSQMADGNKKIAYYQKRISHHLTRSKQIEDELDYFSKFVVNLQKVEQEADQILPLIEKAITGISQLKNIFGVVKQDLEAVVEKAKQAKSEIDILNVKYLIYGEIRSLECKWEQANEKIVLLGQCSRELDEIGEGSP
ncbi:hypothetical protein SK128_013440 [Halocaridina rubra]|uniref:Uncharacterized protein n=1 Tax=Halocaridina rubra TaxID=373956 RepID=A0AAN8WQ56_HALRR